MSRAPSKTTGDVCLEGRKFAVIRLATQSEALPSASATRDDASVLQTDASGGNLSLAGVSIWRISIKDLDAPRAASATIFQSEWGSYRKAIDENYFSKPVIRRIAGFARRAGRGG